MSYNGWYNFETWKINLEVFSGMSADDCGINKRNIDSASDILYNIAYEYATEGVENRFARDIVDNLLSNVNWDEIAEHMTSDLELDDE
jgi:ABC-type taurine transport system ATPase subunit